MSDPDQSLSMRVYTSRLALKAYHLWTVFWVALTDAIVFLVFLK